MKPYTPHWVAAITTKEIKGSRIETIPKGTKFEIDSNFPVTHGYAPCKGLGISYIWNDEFELIKIKRK